jgi:hypothetical protein
MWAATPYGEPRSPRESGVGFRSAELRSEKPDLNSWFGKGPTRCSRRGFASRGVRVAGVRGSGRRRRSRSRGSAPPGRSAAESRRHRVEGRRVTARTESARPSWRLVMCPLVEQSRGTPFKPPSCFRRRRGACAGRLRRCRPDASAGGAASSVASVGSGAGPDFLRKRCCGRPLIPALPALPARSGRSRGDLRRP